MKLKCETNTPAVEKRIMTAARKYFKRRKGLHSVFEHGQWFVMVDDYYADSDGPTIFSVNDAEGNVDWVVDGFCFEEL